MQFGVLFRLVGVMTFILILSCPCNVQGRELFYCDFIEKKLYHWLVFRLIVIETDFFQIWCVDKDTQSCRVTGKLELTQSFCCSVA